MKPIYKCWSCCKPQFERNAQGIRSGMGRVLVCPECKRKDDEFWAHRKANA